MRTSLVILLSTTMLAVAGTITVFDITQPRTYGSVSGGEGGIVEFVDGADGARRLKVTLPVQEKTPVWPKVNFAMPAEYQDWRYVSELTCDVYADEPSSVMSTINGVPVYPTHHFVKGVNTIRYDLHDMASLSVYNLNRVTGMNIFKTSPKAPITFYPLTFRVTLKLPREVIEERLAFLRTLSGVDAAIACGHMLLRKDTLSYDDCQQYEAMVKAAGREAAERALTAATNSQLLGAGFADSCSQIFREKDSQEWTALPSASWNGAGARNERVAAQLVMLPRVSVKEVHVALAGDVKREDGTVLPASSFLLCPIGYIPCTPSSYCDMTRDFPDVILSYTKSLDIPKGYLQPWWIETVIPLTQKAGTYRGTLSISFTCKGNRPETLNLPFSIRVRNFTLSQSPHIPMMISHFNGGCLKDFPVGKEERQVRRRDLELLMHSHRFTPDCIYRGEPLSVEDARFALAHGATHFNIVYINDEISPKKMKQIAAAIQAYKDAGIYDKAYLYCYDEAEPERYPLIIRELTKLKTAFPDLTVVSTIGDRHCGKYSGLDKLIDIWVLGQSWARGESYGDAVEKEARATAKVGLYVACGWTHPRPNHGFIEYPPFDSRMFMGVMMWKLKPCCYLYYAVDLWRYGKANELAKGYNEAPVEGAPVLTNWKGFSYENYNGDGRMVYPAREGTLPSLRLKACALGLQDALYLKCLEDMVNRGTMPQAWQEVARKELLIEDSLMTSCEHFCRVPQPLHQKMARVAALLEEAWTLINHE